MHPSQIKEITMLGILSVMLFLSPTEKNIPCQKKVTLSQLISHIVIFLLLLNSNII